MPEIDLSRERTQFDEVTPFDCCFRVIGGPFRLASRFTNVTSGSYALPTEDISSAIVTLRGQRVILDRDLAAIYGVTTKRLNEQVKRNGARFPEDFMFKLTAAEAAASRSQFATLNVQRGHNLKYLPHAFTEHGAIQAANVLNSPRAIAMSVYVVRAFVRLRVVIASNKMLERKLMALENSLAALDVRTHRQLKEVYELIRRLMAPPPAKRRGIGFTADLTED